MNRKEKIEAALRDIAVNPDKYDFPDLLLLSDKKFEAYNKQMEDLRPSWLIEMQTTAQGVDADKG